jgi:prepilin-type N-terminal cleavage/methylation domain-containing protein
MQLVRRAFTLVEIMIVVVVLGILAAIIIPQFSGATTQAAEGNLATQLDILNNQISIYAARRGNSYPDFATDGWGTAGNPSSMIGGTYIKKSPKNPAWTGGDAASISVVTGAVRGSATTAWVWNSTDKTLYASYYNENTRKVTQTATD